MSFIGLENKKKNPFLAKLQQFENFLENETS